MIRPSFQFYPGDWKSNHKLRGVSFLYRGIWMDVLCMLHDSDEYGVLRWTLADVANAVGCHVNQLQLLVDRGILKGAHRGKNSEAVTFVDKKRRPHVVLPPQDGPIWFSSRMLIDEYRRQRASQDGARGGNPVLISQPLTPPLRGGLSVGLNSSSSSSSVIKQEAGEVGNGESEILHVEVRDFIQKEPNLPTWSKKLQDAICELVRLKGWPYFEKALDTEIKNRTPDPVYEILKRVKRMNGHVDPPPPRKKVNGAKFYAS